VSLNLLLVNIENLCSGIHLFEVPNYWFLLVNIAAFFVIQCYYVAYCVRLDNCSYENVNCFVPVPFVAVCLRMFKERTNVKNLNIYVPKFQKQSKLNFLNGV
jgi:hypothetical protein